LHDIVKRVYEGDKYKLKPIIHINKLGFDNRYENLMYDETDKDVTKNLRKKKRTVVLPEDSGIDIEKIPMMRTT
jgi:regulatory protein YycI of two-component signal transduction system YycFG